MPGKTLVTSTGGRKYAKAKTLPTMPTPSANLDSTPDNGLMFLEHIVKVIGRKQFCYELRVSKHLLDMWLSGKRKNPVVRVQDIMRIAAKCYGPDLPLDIAQDLVSEFGGVVLMQRKTKE